MPFLQGGSTFEASIADVLDTAGSMIASGLETAPALVLGLAVIAALPLLIISGVVVRRFATSGSGDHTARADRTTRIYGSLADQETKQNSSDVTPAPAFSPAVIVTEVDEGPVAEESEDTATFQFGAAIVARIGREEDNDIRLKHPTVHRYHALIRRNYEEGYEIADLSDAAGNGVIVNGNRVSNSPLADGDVIKLGAARLRFSLPR